MIYVVRYTVAACDRCRKECDASRRPKTNAKAKDEAEAKALELGWVQEDRYRPGSLRRRGALYVELVCPECQAIPSGDA